MNWTLCRAVITGSLLLSSAFWMSAQAQTASTTTTTTTTTTVPATAAQAAHQRRALALAARQPLRVGGGEQLGQVVPLQRPFLVRADRLVPGLRHPVPAAGGSLVVVTSTPESHHDRLTEEPLPRCTVERGEAQPARTLAGAGGQFEVTLTKEK